MIWSVDSTESNANHSLDVNEYGLKKSSVVASKAKDGMLLL